MNKRYDVRYYIQNYATRIKYATNATAHLNKFDHKIFNQMVINEAREVQKTYDDKYGTGGFFKWLAVVINNCVKDWPDYSKQMAASLGTIEPGSVTLKVEEQSSFFIQPKEPEKRMCKTCSVPKTLDNFYTTEKTCKLCRKEITDRNKKKEREEYQKSKDPLPPKEEKLMETISDIAFTNEELDMLIDQIKQQIVVKLEVAEKLSTEMHDMHKLIDKLKKRQR